MQQPRLQIILTSELNQCLRHASEVTGKTIGALIEEALRKHPAVQKAKSELGIEYATRQKRGRPKSANV